VITSQGSCFREAAGPDALYTDSADSHQLASYLEKVITDSEVREGVIHGTKKYIERFDPAVIAKMLTTVYSSL
jgi:hypothetical protein